MTPWKSTKQISARSCRTEKEKAARNEKQNAAIEKIVANAEMEIPEPMVESQIRSMINDFARRMQSQGLNMDQYFQFTGMDASRVKRADASGSIKTH